MKFISFAFFLFPLISLAQLSVSPILGVDFINLKRVGYEGPESITLLDKGFNSESLIFGMEVGYMVSEKINLNLKSTYTHKNIEAIKEANFIDIQGIKFNVLESDLTLQYMVSNFYISGGFKLDFIMNMQYQYQSEGLTFNENNGGIVFGLGYKFKKLKINAYYYNAFNEVNFENFISLAPIQSIGIYISYILFKGDRTSANIKCPRV